MNRTDAFVRLLARNHRPLYAYILSLLPNWADADDVLQETTLRLWEQFEKFEEGTDFGAWSRAVARFQVMTRQKQKSRQQERFSDVFLDQLEGARTADTDDLGRHDALLRCIDRLTSEDRELLADYYAPDVVVADVAARRGRTVGSLRVSLHRLRRALRDCVERRILARSAAQP